MSVVDRSPEPVPVDLFWSLWTEYVVNIFGQQTFIFRLGANLYIDQLTRAYRVVCSDCEGDTRGAVKIACACSGVLSGSSLSLYPLHCTPATGSWYL